MFLNDQIADVPQSWIEYRNDSPESVPPFGIVKQDSAVYVGKRLVITIVKSDRFGSQYVHFINGPAEVAPAGYGVCTAGPLFAAYDLADGAPSVEESWGPIADSWLLRKHSQGWRVLKDDAENLGRVLVAQQPMLSVRAVLNEDLCFNKEAAATPTYLTGLGSGSGQGTATGCGSGTVFIQGSWTALSGSGMVIRLLEAVGGSGVSIGSGSVVLAKYEATYDGMIVDAAGC